MDVGTCNGWDAARVVPSAQLRDRIHARWPLHPLDANYRGEVAARHGFDDGAGEVGFVSSRSEEHTSELQSLMRISYAVFCLKKKNIINKTNKKTSHASDNITKK